MGVRVNVAETQDCLAVIKDIFLGMKEDPLFYTYEIAVRISHYLASFIISNIPFPIHKIPSQLCLNKNYHIFGKYFEELFKFFFSIS